MPVNLPDNLLTLTPAGLYCEPGNFHVDPWQPVERAIVTHAHADHARAGSQQYLAAVTGESVMRCRLGKDIQLTSLPFGKSVSLNGVQVTFHPAGHILGSAQVAIEHHGHIVVVSGDYKRQSDSTCRPFEPVRCHTFITESTFGLPVYRWPDPRDVFQEINAWWRENQSAGKATVVFAYSLGKAQRVLAGVDAEIGPIFVHGAVERLNQAYRESGIDLPNTTWVSQADAKTDWSRALIVAPPSAAGTPWLRRLGKISTGMASGWMQIRGTRRRRAIDRGFVLSDHIDWQDLLTTIEETGAERIMVTHGYSDVVVRYLNSKGFEAAVIETEFQGEVDSEVETGDATEDSSGE